MTTETPRGDVGLLNKRLLALIGKHFPAVYDVIPRGTQSRLSRVALNPQPLPPHEWGAAIAAEVIRTAWFADQFGLDPSKVFEHLDDWCPTRPRRIKLPPWWPPGPPPPDWTGGLEAGPHPDPWRSGNGFQVFHLGFAARLAAVSTDFEGTRLAEPLAQAIERSLAAMEQAA